MNEIKERFSDKRRTEITAGGAEMMEDEDLIPRENSVLTLTHNGYIKRLPVKYVSQPKTWWTWCTRNGHE